MTILKLLSLLLILAGKAEQSVSALAPLSEPVLGRDQSGLPPPAQLTPDELVSEFLEKHKDKALDLSEIRTGKIGVISSKSFCSKEESILPVALTRGQYLVHYFSYQVYAQLIHDFSKFIETHMVSLVTDHENPYSGAFHTDSAHSCALSLLGLEAFLPADLEESETTLLSCSVVKLNKESDDVHCVCRSPNLGLTAKNCISMLDSIASLYSINQTVTDLSQLSDYPSYIAMNKNSISLVAEDTVLTCKDSDLKVQFMELFISYSKLTTQVQRISEMYQLSFDVLSCDHDLVVLNFQEMKAFIDCVKKHDPRSRARVKRDLLSALGLRDDISGFVKSANRAIQSNFKMVQENELQIIQQLKLESEAVQSFMEEETRNIDTLTTHVSYLQSVYSSSDRLRHHRAMLVSSLDSLTFAFDQLSQELDQMLQLSLSAMQHEEVVCVQGSCIEVKSLILHKDDSGVRITARQAEVTSEIVYRLSCRMFPVGSALYTHSLNDAALLKFDDRYIDRATQKQIRPECITRHENCPSSPSPVQPKHLIQGNLYLSVHSGQLEAQCIQNTTIQMVHSNITCSPLVPQVVTLPFLHEGRLIDRLSAHVYIAGMREQKAFTESEVLRIKHSSKLPSLTFNDAIIKFYEDPLNMEEPSNKLIIIALVCGLITIILCVCGCCCPNIAAGIIGGIGKVLSACGDGFKYILTCCFNQTIGRHFNRRAEVQPSAPAPNERSCPLNLNDPRAPHQVSPEELVRLQSMTNDYNACASNMTGTAYPNLPSSSSEEYPPMKRQNAFSSKYYGDTVVNTGNLGGLEGVVSYNPNRPQQVKISGTFPNNGAEFTNEDSQVRSNKTTEALRRLSKGFL